METKSKLNTINTVTGKKELSKQLQESEQKNLYLFEYSPISIWEEDFSAAKEFIDELKEQGVTDFREHFDSNIDDLNIVTGLIKVMNINQETLKMFGVKTKEEIPLNIQKYFTEDSLAVFQEEILSFIAGDLIFESSIPIHSLTGEHMILDIKATILPGFEESWEKVLISFVDVTKRKEAEAALKKSELELRNSNQAKDKFFSIIAHDLKSPMNAILGFSKLLLDDIDDFEQSKRLTMLGYIYQSAKNSYSLFENLLTWSRSQVGSIRYQPKTERLDTICDESIGLYSQMAKNKNVNLLNQIPKETKVNADINMISTVLRNLISNAIKFTPENGDVLVEIKPNEELDKLLLLEITVSDNGVGIPKDRLNTLFKISETTTTTGTNNETGTGLGMLICNEFVEKHGGTVWVDSTVNRGTTVHFTLPIA